MALSAAEAALVSSIYDPPRAAAPWMVSDVLPRGEARFYSLGRWALVDALRAAGVGQHDHVLVPGLICREVLASVAFVGAAPVFYAVTPGLRTVDDVLPPAKAVVVVNYFGFPQPLDVFARYCARGGAALIEDNAHGLLSSDSDGRPLGSRGEAGVFSFRKTLAVADGAALVVKEGHQLPVEQPPDGARPARLRYRLKQAARQAVRQAGPTRMVSTIYGVRRMRRAITGVDVPRSAPDAEARIPGAPAASAAVRGPIRAGDPDAERQRRRALFDLVGPRVEAAGGAPIFGELPPGVVPMGFPLRPGTADPPEIARRLRRDGLPLQSWPDLPDAVSRVAPGHYRDLMVVPFLW